MNNNSLSDKIILVVDDISENIQVALNVIKPLGTSIAYAMSGEEALEVIKLQKPSLILLDIMMPGIDGYEVCRQLKSDIEYNNIPIIFLTAKSDIDDLVKGFDLGAVDYINKPFNKRELYVRVRTHLQNYLLQEKIIQKVNLLMEEQNKLLTISYQQSKMATLGEALGAISHQWKQPLTIISINNANILLQETLKDFHDEKIIENVKQIEEQIKFMISTMDDFKNFFVKEQNKTLFSQLEAIYELINIFSDKYLEKKINININSKNKKDIYIFGHKNMYKQAILNIISNAVDQIVQQGSTNRDILIECDIDDVYAVTRIIDYAGKIPSENIEKIFDKFYTTKAEQGTGIGLYMTKQIIEELEGGEISVNNTSDGVEFIIKNSI